MVAKNETHGDAKRAQDNHSNDETRKRSRHPEKKWDKPAMRSLDTDATNGVGLGGEYDGLSYPNSF
ncbi:MAG: hypothetical protein GF419_04650 [Ignavibacteriales bacterium]|nr:hypothetical protein [Ignavibacteriales bacterium]